jgi:hypothetical protein
MDLLRREGEYFFLTLLPKDKRSEIHRQWYQKTSDSEDYEKLVKSLNAGFESNIKYKTSDVKKELFVKLAKHLDKAQNFPFDEINRCQDFPDRCKIRDAINPLSHIDNSLRELSEIGGLITNVFPNVTFVRIKVDGTLKNDLVYTIIRNKFYLNNASLLSNDDYRVMDKDTIDIVSGFVGSYPNFFIEIDFNDVDNFVQEYKKIDGVEKYKLLVDKYGIRRSNPDFWRVSDWFYKKHQYDNPVFAGLFDLNRYKNR